jgi:alpha-mannosidase
VIAVGHAHLDTAWLWPLRETRRKVLRTFANALDLLDRYPDHRYAHSQAVHYAWIEAAHPELFARVQERVAAGQWEPVGGMWVEADLNLSGGESLVRQALHGQRAFERWFGRRSTVGFLPDDFGYPAALPQILRRAGFTSFFTQKLSWNETNRFPHHTFWWEGLDGSRLFTHFSPVDTYNSVLTPGELRFAARNFTDHGGASTSLVLFGHGDGGGGPTAAMVERARRLADVQGVPAVSLGSVEQFFADTLAEYGDRAATWVGEMYLEKHRGTFTSQVRTKQGNVRNERLLREAEIWSVASDVWPGAQLEHLWHEVMVQQFHDILPGSSIAWVHQDAEAIHADVTERCEAIIASALDGSTPVLANPAAVTLDGVVVLEGEAPAGAQPLGAGKYALRAVVPALAGVELSDAVAPHTADVVVSQQSASTVVENGIVSLRWDGRGRLVGYDDMRAGRSLLPAGPAAWSGLVVRPDQPAEFDAWDIDERDARHPGERLDDPVDLEVVASGPLLATVRVTHRWRRSLFVHEVTITADSARVDHVLIADWHEDERRVSFELPLALHAREATCGVQFGHVRRPRHHNTSWDAARFESCAHRFVHIGEHGFGAAILFAGPRGVDVQGEGVALSLLRAPRYPDPGADRGHQEVRWSTWSHIGDPFLAGLEDEAQRVGHPPRLAGRPVAAVVRHDLPGVVVEAVKRAEDGSGDVIVRLWESRGGRSSGRLGLGLGTVDAAWSCNLLEDDERALDVCDGEVAVELAPFELATLRLRACAQGTS